MNTWSVPAWEVLAAAGDELTGLAVATGQPGTGRPEATLKAYTLPFCAPTTTDGDPRLASTGEDSRIPPPGISCCQASVGPPCSPGTTWAAAGPADPRASEPEAARATARVDAMSSRPVRDGEVSTNGTEGPPRWRSHLVATNFGTAGVER